MTPSLADRSAGGTLRLRLAGRLAAALFLLLATLAAVLAFWVAPRTGAAFAAHGDDLLREGAATMRELARRQTADSSNVLVDLIRHTATARQRSVRDLPLDLYGGDVHKIRSSIEEEDAQRSARQQRNVEVLATEMQRRAEEHIDERLRQLTQRQLEATRAFVDGQRATHVTLVAIALAAMLAVLGVGLHFFVLRPTLKLRAATQRVARGELAVDLPRPSGDELGDLARDFTGMVHQLRDSRAELQRLAAGLEQEVHRKTEHLERTLADLRSSHQQLAMAERLAALGTLAGGIAHEFHNLIGGIRGCAAELLADEAAADRRETLAVITRASDRATGIVQQLLRFARRSVETIGDVDPSAVVEDALRLCEPAARRQNVRVERNLEAGLAVRGDADGLHQVIVNLVTNALQAMPGGGTLRVASVAAEDGIMLRVADSGAGIPPQDLPHVFEPFFTTRGHEADPGKRGTGLGLAVSYGIVSAHGGSITANSEPGAGACFTILLPRTR